MIDSYFSRTKIKSIIDKITIAKKLLRRKQLLFGTIDTFLLWRLTKGKSHVTDATNVGAALTSFSTGTDAGSSDLIPYYDVSASAWEKGTIANVVAAGPTGPPGPTGPTGPTGATGSIELSGGTNGGIIGEEYCSDLFSSGGGTLLPSGKRELTLSSSVSLTMGGATSSSFAPFLVNLAKYGFMQEGFLSDDENVDTYFTIDQFKDEAYDICLLYTSPSPRDS